MCWEWMKDRPFENNIDVDEYVDKYLQKHRLKG